MTCRQKELIHHYITLHFVPLPTYMIRFDLHSSNLNSKYYFVPLISVLGYC